SRLPFRTDPTCVRLSAPVRQSFQDVRNCCFRPSFRCFDGDECRCGEFVGRFIQVAQRLEIFKPRVRDLGGLTSALLEPLPDLFVRSFRLNKTESDASSSKFVSKLIAKEPPAVGRI